MPKRIFITGEPENLRDRLPGESEGHQLEWLITPVIEFSRLPVQLPADIAKRDWIFFPSARSVEFWPYEQATVETLGKLHVACMGPESRRVAEEAGWRVDFVPTQSGTEGFIREFRARFGEKAHSLLLPCAKEGRKTLVASFSEAGWTTLEIPVYETRVRPHLDKEGLNARMQSADLLIFTSPSSLKAVLSLTEIPRNRAVACLGSYTAGFLEKAGLKPHLIEPGEYDKVGRFFQRS